MLSAHKDFRAKLDAAREWEKKLAAWCQARGWYVVPTYDFCGKDDDKAPKLLAPSGKSALVLPDLQCFRDGEHRWLECKYKTHADLYRRGDYRVTGISLRLFQHYQLVERATGARVILAFLHEREREIRGASLRELKAHHSHDYTGTKMGRHGMRFWRYEDLPRWCSLQDVAELEAA